MENVVIPAGSSVVVETDRRDNGEKFLLAELLNSRTIESQHATDVEVQAATNVAALGVQAEKLGAANVLQQQVLATAAALAAATNFANTQATILQDGQKTRDLVNAINDQNNAIALVDAKNEIAILKTKLGVV